MITNMNIIDLDKLKEPLKELELCNLCPRNCNANRINGKPGYCQADDSFSISSICIHRGEEPPISGGKGICNIFFTNCNLQCSYCQNYQISKNNLNHNADKMSLRQLLRQITYILDTGINAVGFVSPSHFIPQVKVIINALHEMGYHPVFVYNSNGYDKVEELVKFEGLIDVYLPDFKYMDNNLSKRLSDTEDYPQTALNAIKEMYRQVGSELRTDAGEQAVKGLIIRHLVLPGNVQNSLNVLQEIACKITPEVSISLMSQYYPTFHVAAETDLGRTLRQSEYKQVVEEMEHLGMYNGWIQDMESYENYRPDFDRNEHPFE